MGRRLRIAALWALACAFAPSPTAAADDPRASDVYLRRRVQIPDTVRWLAQEARRIRAAQVLFVFDTVTFAPPPGLTEFTMDYAFFRDLPRWLDELGPWAAESGVSFRATTSRAPKTIEVGAPDWSGSLSEMAAFPWWETETFGGFEPATKWMQRLLVRSQDAPGVRVERGRRMLVLVTGGIGPERVVPPGTTHWEAEWRSKLLPVGEYWEPDEVAATLERANCALYVVAPEARFGEFTPIAEIAEAPWASRPQFPPLGSISGPSAPLLGPTAGRSGLREQLEERLKDKVPDPAERRALIDRILGGLPDSPRPPTGPTTPTTPSTPDLPTAPTVAARTGGYRYWSSTPIWFPHDALVIPKNNHAPSSYGIWPLARSVARAGGRYLFYPFPETRWLDVCPADNALLDRLAPELVPYSHYLSRRNGDAALDAICRASAKVVRDTPWADTFVSHRDASGWSAVARAAPLRLESDWSPRRVPFDDALQGSQQDIAILGRRLADEVLPQYDAALQILEEAVGRAERGQDAGSHPRSVANLYLARFWFAMSAFHLEAYSIYAREVERFIPESMKGRVDRIYVTYVTTIRMSDCLDAYDGRVLTSDAEEAYERWVPEEAPGYQGNLLRIPTEDPNYRAKRSLDRVILHLDPRLRRRALAMIRAGREVMERYARTGWGWSTYYADADTFIFKPVESPRGPHPMPGDSEKPPKPPTTPSGPGTTPGGSAPDGPRTP